MAGLIINDPYGGGQELVNFGRSQIPLRETYSVDPRAAGAQYADRMKNVNQLVDSLSSLTKTIGGIEEQNRKLEADNAEAYVQEVSGKLNSTDPIDKQLATLRPDLNPWTRAAMTQIIARQNAQTVAQTAIENMPMEARQSPEATQKYFDEVVAREGGRVAGQPFYTSPFIGALKDQFNKRSGQLSTERTTVMTEAMRQDGRTQQYNAMEGLIKNGQLPVDPTKAPNPEEASEVVAFAQKMGVSPLNVAMLLQGQQAQTTPDQFGAVPQVVPMKQRIAELERQLIAGGVKPGATFADMYKAVNPKGNAAEDAKVNFPKAAEFLGLPLDERSTTVGGRAANATVTDAVPNDAKRVLEFVSKPESGGNYDAYIGNAGNKAIKVSNMTLNEVREFQRKLVNSGAESGAVGRYQIIGKTLNSLIQEMNLDPATTKFTPELQDRMAMKLLERRGYNEWKSGKLSDEQFANNIAQEWAGVPVVSGTKAGASFYAGVGSNKAGVSVGSFMDALKSARSAGSEVTPASASERTAVIAMGTNDFSNPGKTYENTLAAIKRAKDSGMNVVVVAPNGNDPRFAKVSEEVQRAAKDAGVTLESAKYDPNDPLHITMDEAKRISKAYPNAMVLGDSNAVRLGMAQGGKVDGQRGQERLIGPNGEVYAQTGANTDAILKFGATTPTAATPSNPNDPDKQPLSPEAYQLRQVFFNVDGIQDKTHPLYSRTQRKQDAIANVKQIAMQSLNPDLLSAIPTSILTPAEREDISNWSLSIRKEIKSQQDAAWTQRARAQEMAVEEANKQVNAALINLKNGQELNSDQRAKLMLDLNNIDPKLADGFAEKYNKIQSGKMDPKMEGEIYRDLEQQLYDTVSSGGDPTKVPLGRQTDPELSKKLGDLARSLAKDGGELREPFYKDAYGKAMASIYGMIGEGAAIRINNPGVYTYMMSSFNRFLIEEVNKFKTQTGVSNITADDQRSMIFNNTLKRVLRAYPQEAGASADTIQKILNDGQIPPGTNPAKDDADKKRTEDAVKKFGFGNN